MEEFVQQIVQIKGVSLKPKSSRLSETLAAILAQAIMLLSKREFMKKPKYFAILAQARIWSPKRDPFLSMKYSISPKRDSTSLSETSCSIYSLEVQKGNQQGEKLEKWIWRVGPRSRAYSSSFLFLLLL